jgi:hypothetical protein
MDSTSLISALPTPDAYREITSKFKSARPLCSFYFVLDGYPETAHKPSYGFAGGKASMMWFDFINSDASPTVEWSAVEALTPEDFDTELTVEKVKARGSGYIWNEQNGFVRSLIIGEEFICFRDAINTNANDPCAWLPNLAWQCKGNQHLAIPDRESLQATPSLSKAGGDGNWPVELLEPTVRQHVVRTPAGSPDHLIIGLAIRDEYKEHFTDREGSEFCLPLHASSDDPQAWTHLEFFAELYAGFYEKQVAPFIGRPFRLYPNADHVFRRLDDLSGIRSAVDLPIGDPESGTPSFEEGEIRANVESFIDQACSGARRSQEEAVATNHTAEAVPLRTETEEATAPSPEHRPESPPPLEGAKSVMDCLRDSDLTFTEKPGLAATRIEFTEVGRQQVVCVITDPRSPSMSGHGRIAVYSAIKDGVTAEDLFKVMSAVGAAAPIGGFRVDEGRLIFQAELPSSTWDSDLEQVVLTCARVADACESMLTDGSDEH